MKAIVLKDIHEGRQRLFKLDPPLDGNKFVVSSICNADCAAIQGYWETYLFAADADGCITIWCELPGSQKRCRELNKPLEDLGYEIITDPQP